MLSRHSSGTQVTLTDTSSANTKITAAIQIAHTDCSSTNAKITATTQITHTDISSADTDITAAALITHTDTSSADTNITAATLITHTDTSSADTKITAATLVTHTDTSSADTKITAATLITHTISHWHLFCKHQYNCGDTDHSHKHLLCRNQYNCGDTDHSHWHLFCKHQNNCGATDHSHRHLSCKHQYNCGATEHSHRHLRCKHQYNCGDTDRSHRHLRCKHQYKCGDTSQLDTLSGSLQVHSPLWRALRRTRKRLRSLANGCGHRHNFPRTQPHPQTPKWNGNPRYAFGKKSQIKYPSINYWVCSLDEMDGLTSSSHSDTILIAHLMPASFCIHANTKMLKMCKMSSRVHVSNLSSSDLQGDGLLQQMVNGYSLVTWHGSGRYFPESGVAASVRLHY